MLNFRWTHHGAFNVQLLGLGMPGVSGPLVDDEGFPRGDIDLYAVRQARNKYVCAQTDHIEIMRKIEQARAR